VSKILYCGLLSLALLSLLSANLLSQCQRGGKVRLELVSRMPTEGTALAVALDRGTQHVYVSAGSAVVEFLQETPGFLEPSPQGRVGLPAQPVALEAADSRVYACSEDGVRIVDARQRQVIHSSTGFAAYGLRVDENQIYVAADDAANNECGLLALDHSLSRLGKLVDACESGVVEGFSMSLADLTFRSPYAYLVGTIVGGFTGIPQGFFTMADVSQPGVPTRVGALVLQHPANAVEVVGDLAYVAGQHLWIVDVSSPVEPAVVGYLAADAELTALAVSPPYVYATGADGKVRAYDTHVSARPALAATYDTGFAAHDLCIQEPYLYVADGEGGLVVLRIVT
jgi:hypothetical protein